MLIFIEPKYPWEEILLFARRNGLRPGRSIDASRRKYNEPMTFSLALSSMAGSSAEAYKAIYTGVVPLSIIPITMIVDDYTELTGPIRNFDLANHTTVLHGSLLDWKLTIIHNLSRGAQPSQREYAARLFMEFKARDYSPIWAAYSFDAESLILKEK